MPASTDDGHRSRVQQTGDDLRANLDMEFLHMSDRSTLVEYILHGPRDKVLADSPLRSKALEVEQSVVHHSRTYCRSRSSSRLDLLSCFPGYPTKKSSPRHYIRTFVLFRHHSQPTFAHQRCKYCVGYRRRECLTHMPIQVLDLL